MRGDDRSEMFLHEKGLKKVTPGSAQRDISGGSGVMERHGSCVHCKLQPLSTGDTP